MSRPKRAMYERTPASALSPERRLVERLPPVLLFVAVTIAAILSIRSLPVGVFQDDGIYVVLAKSLATGSGYRYVNLPGEPFATHYPPLYPMFLAGLWKLSPTFPSNVALFKFANAILLAVSAMGFYRLTKKVAQFPPVWCAIAVGAFTISAPTLLVSAMLLSEPMFLVLLAISLIAAERAASSGSPRDASTAAIMIVALAMCRTIGLVLLPALVFILFRRKQMRAALIALAIGIIGILPWQIWVAVHGNAVPPVLLGKYGPYFEWVALAVQQEGTGFLFEVTQTNVQQLWSHLCMLAGFTGETPVLLRATAASMLGTTLILGALRLGRRAPVTLLFLINYFVVVLLWPFSPTRFLYAVWPLIGLVFAMGIHRLVEWWREWARARHSPPWKSATAAILISANVVGIVAFNVRRYVSEREAGVERASAERALPTVEWVLENTSPRDIIASDDDVLLHLYTGREAIPATSFRAQDYLQLQTDEFIVERTRELLNSYRPKYLIASTLMAIKGARGLVQPEPSELKHVATLRVGAVFEAVSEQP